MSPQAVGHAQTRVLIVGDKFSFPHGTGATTRVLTIAKGLLAAGADVRVLVTRYFGRDLSATRNRDPEGVFEGVPYAYSTGTTVRPEGFVQRRLSSLKGVVGVAGPIVSLEGDPPDAVLLFTGHTVALPAITWLMTRLRDAALLFDGCEKPYVYEQGSSVSRAKERLYTPLMFRVYDGVFAISDYLVDYFMQRVRRDARVMLLPILVDADRFAPPARRRATGAPRYIAYSGALGETKGVHTLVRAFALIADTYPDARLKISGSGGSSAYGRELTGLATRLGVAERVDFVGMVSFEEYPRLLHEAQALVVPHAKGESSEAAFPTKLGEYLASGTVTVASRVGEIAQHVRDGDDLYLVPPDDPVALAQRLGYVLGHPDEASRVGSNGRETARRQFDYRRHGQRLLLFIRDLATARRRPCAATSRRAVGGRAAAEPAGGVCDGRAVDEADRG